MTSTLINFNLTKTFLSDYSAANDYVYAFAFNSDGTAYTSFNNGTNTLTLISAGTPQTTSTSILDGTFGGGQIVLVAQHNGTSTAPPHSTTSDIRPDNSSTYNYSYQLIELSLGNQTTDQADISSLNTFGFDTTLSIPNGPSSGYLTSTQSLYSLLDTQFPAAVSKFNNTNIYRLAEGPATNASIFPSADWTNYTTGLSASSAILNQMEIVTSFNGSNVSSTPSYNAYKVNYNQADSSFILSPEFPGMPNTNTHWLKISLTDAQQNIYAQTGTLKWSPTGTPGSWQSYTSFTPNNADGDVAKYFVAGFDAGYWGSTATDANSLYTATSNLNQTWNWARNYAYQGSLVDGNQAYGAIDVTNTLGTGPGTQGGNNRFYDPWAQIIQDNGNPYGYSYSDLLSIGGASPAISSYGTNSNVAEIDIGLYGYSKTPPADLYQTSPSGWLAPTLASQNYGAATTFSSSVGPSNQNEIKFTFDYTVSYNGQSFSRAPDSSWPAEFRIYAPGNQQAASDGFIHLALNNGNWSYFTVATNAAGNLYLNNTNPTGETGTFDIRNIPVTSDGSPAWYQIAIGTNSAQKVYNIYANSNSSNLFTQVVTDPTVSNSGLSNGEFAFNFAPGGVQTYSPILYFNTTNLGLGGEYELFFNRAPDPGGFQSWSQALASGQSLIDVGNAFAASPENGVNTLTNPQFVDLMYQNGFGRAPDPAGLAYWVAALQSGTSRGTVAVNIYNSPEFWTDHITQIAGNVSPLVTWPPGF